MKYRILSYFILLPSLYFYSQQNVFPIMNTLGYKLEKQVNKRVANIHTSIQPYNLSTLKEISIDSFSTKTKLDKQKRAFLNSLKKIFISPIGGGDFGINLSNSNLNYFSSLGMKFQLNATKKFGLGLNYRYLLTEQEKYIDTSIFSRDVVPSVGRQGLLPSQNNGAHDIQGYLAYTPNHFFSFMLGKGNHFWGDGYRSFLLSDNASSYPYFRIETSFWNVKYTNLYSSHTDISSGTAKDKYSASHHLSWNVTEDINFGLFETVIWAGNDTLINRGFDINYINPVIFYRPVEYAQGSNDNSILGVNFKGRIKDNHLFYAQLLLDEFLLAELRSSRNWWGNKYAIQLGYKNYELFNNPNLYFLIERNISRPFTYAHINGTLNYGHLNQSLAHPLGANFKETVAILSYQKNKWNFKEKVNFISFGADTSATSFGGDIYKNYSTRNGDYGHQILQGETHRVFLNEISVSYTLIDAINLKAFGSFIVRNENTTKTHRTDLFFKIGIATRLWNSYKDY